MWGCPEFGVRGVHFNQIINIIALPSKNRIFKRFLLREAGNNIKKFTGSHIIKMEIEINGYES